MTCYEFAIMCDLKPDVSQEVIDTLRYMTRSDDSDFETSLEHPLFIGRENEDFEDDDIEEDDSFEDEFDYLAEWKTIISNIPNYGQELRTGIFGSIFRDRKLNIRKFVGDDDFYNAFPDLIEWLTSVCESTGFAGYYARVGDMDLYHKVLSEPILIYFIDGKAFEKKVDSELKGLFSSDN